MKTSMVGTINCIQREFPQEIESSKAPLHSTKILRNNNTILPVYQGKVNNSVLILRTVHKNVSISEEGKNTSRICKILK